MSSQQSFSIRVSSGVKSVHLLGSWDNYVGQLPLSKDKTSSKSGTWKGTFKFSSSVLEAGQRYWYYFIIDGYHVAHNPSVTSVNEPTTGRDLNILDVAKSSSSKSSSSSSSSKSSSRHSSSSSKDKSSSRSSRSRSSLTVEIPKGRPLSVSQIKAPKPMSPHATKNIRDYAEDEINELTARFGAAGFEDEDIVTNFSSSPVSSTGSSLSYRSDSSSPSSAVSGYSTPGSDMSECVCERYGITRKGERVRIDCGGVRCGYGDESSDCCSDEEYEVSSSNRHGIVVR